MSAKACLAVRLESPLQSWGTSSRQNERRTNAFPSRSALCGMFCAALGYERGSEEEKTFLKRCAALHLLTVAVPRHTVSHLRDFQTVAGTLRATGKEKPTHLISRYYLQDAVFFAFFSGEHDILEQIATALENPVWGVWLGRKCCIPSAPLYAGIHSDEEAALKACVPDKTDMPYIRDAIGVVNARSHETLFDMPEDFSFGQRRYLPRRVSYGDRPLA